MLWTTEISSNMIKFYHVHDSLYHNKSLIADQYGILVSKRDLTETALNVTWDNLTEMMSMDSLIGRCLTIKNKPKGRVVRFSWTENLPFGDYASVKEWKTPDLNITLKTTYKEYTPTLKEVFEWYDLETVHQYLTERGFIFNAELLSELRRN